MITTNYDYNLYFEGIDGDDATLTLTAYEVVADEENVLGTNTDEYQSLCIPITPENMTEVTWLLKHFEVKPEDVTQTLNVGIDVWGYGYDEFIPLSVPEMIRDFIVSLPAYENGQSE